MGLRDHRPVEIANLRDDFHTCAIGIQRTEHGVGLVALQYHMRGENRRHMQHTGRATFLDLIGFRSQFRSRRGTSRSNHGISSY